MRPLLVFLCLLGVVISPVHANSPSQRERAEAIFARCVAAYKQLTSFDIQTRETYFHEGKPRTDVRFQAAMGAPNWKKPSRGFLRGQSANPFSPAPILLRHDALVRPTYFGVVRDVHTPHEKQDLTGHFQSVFEDSHGLSPLAMALSGAFIFGDLGNVKHIQETRDEVRVVLSDDNFSQEWVFDAKTHFLKRRTFRPSPSALQKGRPRWQNNVVFAAPKSNWRGSWAATDAAVYNVPNVFGTRTVAQAVAENQIRIEPQAREIFERAERLYAQAKTVSLQIRAPETNQTSPKTLWHLDFERPTNRWRLRWHYGFHVANGRQIFGARRWEYSILQQNQHNFETFTMNLYERPTILWAEMILGTHPLSLKSLEAQALARNVVDASVVEPVMRDGTEFQRVRVAITNRYESQKPFVTFYDFAPNGALAAGFGGESDAQALADSDHFIAEKQEFDVPIPREKWAFYPPRGTTRTSYPNW